MARAEERTSMRGRDCHAVSGDDARGFGFHQYLRDDIHIFVGSSLEQKDHVSFVCSFANDVVQGRVRVLQFFIEDRVSSSRMEGRAVLCPVLAEGSSPRLRSWRKEPQVLRDRVSGGPVDGAGGWTETVPEDLWMEQVAAGMHWSRFCPMI